MLICVYAGLELEGLKKLVLMKRFMNNLVGKGINLVIVEKDGAFRVHTIEIMQKTDDTCPAKGIPVGDYFLHLVATSPAGHDASIVCDWTDDLLKNLMQNYKDAKDANSNQIKMYHDPQSSDQNRWLLAWGNEKEEPKPDPVRYVS